VRYVVIFRPEARDEAIEAARRIAAEGFPDTARRWYEGLEQAVASLSSMPRRCPRAREQAAYPRVELRQLLFRSHRLIFTVRGREVHVLHERHVVRANLRSLTGDDIT
jgi:plasmid stabilization system protein ParE